MNRHLSMGPGAEFDAVRALLAQWGAAAEGVGDDGAVLDVPAGSRLVVSTDTTVEDVHFRRHWMTPEEIGWRATQAALSDLAAMGATPLGVLLALTVPTNWRDELTALADGIAAATRSAAGVVMLLSSPDPVSVGSSLSSKRFSMLNVATRIVPGTRALGSRNPNRIDAGSITTSPPLTGSGAFTGSAILTGSGAFVGAGASSATPGRAAPPSPPAPRPNGPLK